MFEGAPSLPCGVPLSGGRTVPIDDQLLDRICGREAGHTVSIGWRLDKACQSGCQLIVPVAPPVEDGLGLVRGQSTLD